MAYLRGYFCETAQSLLATLRKHLQDMLSYGSLPSCGGYLRLIEAKFVVGADYERFDNQKWEKKIDVLIKTHEWIA